MKTGTVKMYFMCGLFLAVSHAMVAQETVFKHLSVTEFNNGLKSSNDEVLLDLRTTDEVKKGIIADAKQLDYFGDDFKAELGKLDKNRTYFIYCAEGGRSAETMELMQKQGFKKVYNLEDGFSAWKKQKMPVATVKNH